MDKIIIILPNVFGLLFVQISGEWSSGAFVIKPGDEDIHTANERRLKVRGLDCLHTC